MTENDERVLRDIIIGGNGYDYDESILQSIFEEIKQYKTIGTIDEFKALKEKNTPKKVNIQQWIYTKCECGYEFSKHHGDGYYSIPYEKQTKHCPDCGQKLDWQ